MNILAALARWLWDDHCDEAIGSLITPPVKKFTGFDPSLRERSTLARDRADAIRRQAHRVEAGDRRPETHGMRKVG